MMALCVDNCQGCARHGDQGGEWFKMMLEMLLPSHAEPCEALFTDYRAGFFPKCHGKPLKKFGL